MQETVISVAKNIEGFKYDPAICFFKTWMLQLTRWRIANQLKKRAKESGEGDYSRPAGHDPHLEEVADPAGFDLEAIWEEEWEKNLLGAALERVKLHVDAEQFQIFDLYCLEEWPAQKVARTLHVGVGRVYLAKHRVGGLLKKELKRLEAGRT